MGGVLADYVPFYFAYRTPMLYVIFKRGIEGYLGTQEDVVYLVSSVESITSDCTWCFTDGHAVEALTRFYTSINDLVQVDWNAVRERQWQSVQDQDLRRRKQAEFLVRDFFRWEWVESITVRDYNRKQRVNELLASSSIHVPPVEIIPRWYY
jgi:hypothetical protein